MAPWRCITTSVRLKTLLLPRSLDSAHRIPQPDIVARTVTYCKDIFRA
jgi:hypothetical protein